MMLRFICVTLLFFVCFLDTTWAAERPNIIFILSDDLAQGDLAGGVAQEQVTIAGHAPRSR